MKKKTTISEKQHKFLDAFLRTKSLEDLLPLYLTAISGNPELFALLPRSLINPVQESLRKFQEVAGSPEVSEESSYPQAVILRNLRGLDSKGLLSNYVRSVSKGATVYLQTAEAIRVSAEGWLNELRACVIGKNGLFSNEFDPETFVDGFIEFAGGARLTNLLGSNIPTQNADYFFRQENVIVELKILKTDFLESNKEKLESARKEALTKVKITPGMILGTDTEYPKELFDAEFRILRDALQRITKGANKQIRNSRTLLNSPSASGIVMFLIDGFYSVSPFLMIELLHEPVSRQFSAVNALIFVNFRRKVTLDVGDGPYDYFIFEPRYKPDFPEWLPPFVDNLGLQWFEYLQLLSGKRFDKRVLSYNSRNLLAADWK